jgi:hypothetical protein
MAAKRCNCILGREFRHAKSKFFSRTRGNAFFLAACPDIQFADIPSNFGTGGNRGNRGFYGSDSLIMGSDIEGCISRLSFDTLENQQIKGNTVKG